MWAETLYTQVAVGWVLGTVFVRFSEDNGLIDAPLRRPNALLALTDGPRPARLFAKGGASWTLSVPKIECVNAIGAGDVCTGVLLHSLASGMSPPDAFAMGLAAACARCTHNLPEFTPEEVQAMRADVRIEEASPSSAAQ